MALLDDLLNALGLGGPSTAAGKQEASGPIYYPAPQETGIPFAAQPGIPAPEASQVEWQNLVNSFVANGMKPQQTELEKAMQDEWNTTVNSFAAANGIGQAPVESTKIAGSGHAGVDRVNAGTGNTGIRAVLDKDGKVTLTNVIGPDPMANRQGIPTIQKGAKEYDAEGNAIGPVAPSPEQASMQNNAQALLTQLRTAKDSASATALLDSIRNAVATESSKLQEQALQHANNALQVPLLQSQLLLAQQEDQARGIIGDGPRTAKIRTDLEQARGLAEREAQNILSRNVTYKSLLITSKAADEEAARLARKEDKMETFTAQKTFAAEQKEAAKREEQERKAAGLSTELKTRLRKLQPELEGQDDVALVAALDKHQGNGNKDGFFAALEEPKELLPLLAIEGNHYAKSILVSTERTAGIPDAVTSERLKKLEMYMRDPKQLSREIGMVIGSNNEDDIKAQIRAINAGKLPGGNKELAAQANAIKRQAALLKFRNEIQNDFTRDVSSWAPADPVFQEAVKKAREVANRSDLKSITIEYVGSVTGPERKARLDALISYAREAASKTQGSQLGAVDPVILQRDIESIEVRRFLERSNADFVEAERKNAAERQRLTNSILSGNGMDYLAPRY